MAGTMATEIEVKRLNRALNIQRGNANRWKDLALTYKREIERLMVNNAKLTTKSDTQ